jgi:hypothetical protein
MPNKRKVSISHLVEEEREKYDETNISHAQKRLISRAIPRAKQTPCAGNK